jgi:hypothetical protein
MLLWWRDATISQLISTPPHIKEHTEKKYPSKDMSKRPPPYFNGKREIAVNSRSSTTREIRNSNSHQLKLVQGIYHNI